MIKLYIERWDFFVELLIQHLFITLVSVCIITVMGVSLGIIMHRKVMFAKGMLLITNFLYTIPSIALFGVLVIIIGIGNKSAIVALVIYGLLPVIRNTYVGLQDVDPEVIEAAKGMGSTQKQLLLQVQLPLALPIIIAGIRTMVVMTIALCGIASFIGAGGLGVAIWRGITTNFAEMTMAGSLLVALLAILADLLLGRVENYLKLRYLGLEN